MTGDQRFFNLCRHERGFTLIEMMIVLAIMGGIVALSMPYMSSRNAKTKSFLRQFTVMSRELHTRAKLQGTVYRLVIDLKNQGDGLHPPVQQFWVERANGKAVVKADEEKIALEAARNGASKAVKDPRGFQVDTSINKGQKELPSGLRFEKVELTRLDHPVTEGKAYIHYLPEGLVDEAAIHLKGEKNQAWTISIHPLTGKAELITKSVTLQEMKSQ